MTPPSDPITRSDDLAAFCAEARAYDFITVDTEFMRERTYWSQLCLIQIAHADAAVAVDPLAEGLDLAPFWALLADDSVVKALHAARQDIEIFVHLGDVVPNPLFDTQIAAMACGLGDQISYENIVQRLVGARVDKASRFTDWSRRPLDARQLAYALADVTHLRDVYRALRDRLAADDRGDWVAEEMAALVDPALYRADPDNAWTRLKTRNDDPRFLAVLQALAAWREREAQTRDVPRARVVKDDALIELATQRPEDAEAMARLRAIPKGFHRSSAAAAMLEAIRAGLASVPADARRQRRRTPPTAPPAVVEMLKLLLKLKCEAHGVAPRLVASAAEIERIALEDDPDTPALRGWRRAVFGADALRVKAGELAISLDGAGMRLTAVAPPSPSSSPSSSSSPGDRTRRAEPASD